MKHAVRVRHVILSPIACPAVQHFPHYLINSTTVGKKHNWVYIVWFCLFTTFVWNIAYSKKNVHKEVVNFMCVSMLRPKY